MSDPHGIVLELLYGRWRSQATHAGVSLGVFEAIGSEPVHSDAVARELELAPEQLYRLLRALSSLELLTEHDDRRFSLTDAGRLLRGEDPQSLRDLVLLREGPEHTAIWKHLTAIVRDGRQDGFEREYGRTAFEHAAAEPSYGQAFDAGMSSHSRLQSGWVLEALRDRDFAAIRHLCDVGGGQGHLLSQLLLQTPHLRGTVLERSGVADQGEVPWAVKLGVADRCRYVVGDMFAEVPAADAYLMKMILHDWNDEQCLRILQNAHRSAPAGGRMFVVEHVIPTANTAHFSTLFDLHMMCWGAGRERSEREYVDLLERAGWKLAATWYPVNRFLGVVEGAKA
jgi:hypothetical protein